MKIEILLKDVPYEQDIREIFMAFFYGAKFYYEENEDFDIRFLADRADDGFRTSIIFRDGSKISECIAEAELRMENKNRIKRYIYHTISARYDMTLPWGILTGIRPTKIVMELLEKAWKLSDIRVHLSDTYLVSDEKIELCMETALVEKRILDTLDYENGYSLYIGIPFCPSTCVYCSFTSYPIKLWEKEVEIYVNSLCKELSFVADKLKDRKLQTIYMGGGTPTSIGAEALDRILTCVKEHFDVSHLLEFSVEAGRADSITREKLEVLKKHKVDRISINPQSMNEKTLEKIGRKHTVSDFVEKFRLARELGFDNINTDLIMGLMGEGLEEATFTMEEIRKLNPESVTVHSLALKRAARLNLLEDKFDRASFDTMADMLDISQRICHEMNLYPYYMYRQKNIAGNFENVGYSKQGKECIYNILIMEEKQSIIACGAGTTTKLVYREENRVERIENVKDPKLYTERLQEMLDRKNILNTIF